MESAPQDRLSLISLPYDILLDIAIHLSGRDLARLLSTCRALHTHINDDAFWRPQCARFSLMDISHSHCWSRFLDAYKLLDTYGPLLGLWASDQPYIGGILEFRLDVADSSIVGEFWRFPHADVPDDAEPDAVTRPEFWEAVRLRHSAAGGHTELGQDLHVLGPTHERAVLFYRPFPPSPLPEFPAPDAPWLDRAPRLPRLPAQAPASSEDLRAAATFPPYPVLSMTPSASLKPPALVLTPGAPSAVAGEHTLHPLRDMRNLHADGGDLRDGGALGFCARYYPVRATPPPPPPPPLDDAEWSAAALEGLWLGDYGPHGTEVLFLECDAPRGAVRAWKMTGDLNVLRGAQTWMFECARAVEVDAVGEAWPLEPDARVFGGVGTVCGTGFRVDQRATTDVFVAVTGMDVIKVMWVDLGHRVATYRRYWRDIGKEKESPRGVRIQTA